MAHEKAASGIESRQSQQASGMNGTLVNGTGPEEVEGDDDGYWAQYDKTPGRTPAIQSPRHGVDGSPETGDTAAEDAYFEQYSQVQPDMDNDDPSQDRETLGESSLNGNVLGSITQRAASGTQREIPSSTLTSHLIAPRPTESSTDSPGILPERVSQLEDSATLQSNMEVAMRQHVSTTVKSLFRMCQRAGMELPEFDEMIRTELQTLTMLSDDG